MPMNETPNQNQKKPTSAYPASRTPSGAVPPRAPSGAVPQRTPAAGNVPPRAQQDDARRQAYLAAQARQQSVMQSRGSSGSVPPPAARQTQAPQTQTRRPAGQTTARTPGTQRAPTAPPQTRTAASGASGTAANRTSRNTSAAKKTRKNKKANKVSVFDGSGLHSILKAVAYIAFVLVVSGFLGYFGILMGNDVFALVKPDLPVDITIGEETSLEELSEILAANQVIKYPKLFVIYGKLRHFKGTFLGGTQTVNSSMNYDQLRKAFLPKTVRTTVSVTIPEGYNVQEIINLFVNHYGMGTEEGFRDVIENYDFDFWFLDELSVSADRTYRLEGYLYPDTYYFYSNASEADIIYKLLARFNEIFDESYRDRCTELGYTVDEVVTLASIIQMEAKYESEYRTISSVFHNRMNNPSYTTGGGRLQSDATVQYILKTHKVELTDDDLATDNPYNTYLYAGLPPGPITNPRWSAIAWALYPDETNYYYFVAKKDGYSLFAETYEEHLKNILAAQG